MKLCHAVCLMITLAACTPQEQPREAVVREPVIEGHVFRTDTGTDLPMRSWHAKGKPKAVVAAIHGFNDYSHAWEPLGKYLSGRGYTVYAYDQRGFGAAPNTGIWGGEENFTGDVKAFLRAIRVRHPELPLYAVGESMGGAILAQASTQSDFPPVDGIVFSAPALWGKDAFSQLGRMTLWLWAHVLPAQKLTGEDLDILASDNLPMLHAMGQDPLVIKETRVDTVYGLAGLMYAANESAPAIDVPVLLLYGQQDEVVMAEPVGAFYGRLQTRKTFACYPNGYHMLTRDLQGKKVMRDIAQWFEKPNKKLPSDAEVETGECLHVDRRHER